MPASDNHLARVRQLLDVVINDPRSMPDLAAADLDLALRLTRRVNLLGRLAVTLERANKMDTLPQSAADHLASARVMAEARERVAKWELNRIAWAMRSEPNVPLIAMKGCAYLLLALPNTKGRIFADVDLLIAEELLTRVEARLVEMRWQGVELTPYDDRYYRKWTHELPPLVHVEREVEIDLHHSILPRTARLNPASRKLIDSAQKIPGSRYQALSGEDIVLHAMTHLMFDSDLADKLRDLVDIAELLRHYAKSDQHFWQSLLSRAEELDLGRPAYYGLYYARLLLGARVPASVLDDAEKFAPPRLVAWLMDQLVPRALYPQHPDHPSRVTEFCRLLLFVRSHWIRMPPWLLAYHLSYKTAMRAMHSFGAKKPAARQRDES